MCCSVLQRVAVCCSVLQCVAEVFNRSTALPLTNTQTNTHPPTHTHTRTNTHTQVELPENYYVGLTAHTGQVADNHDVFSECLLYVCHDSSIHVDDLCMYVP